MAYVTRAWIENKVPTSILNDALDDDDDGKEDAGRFDSVVADCSGEVDGFLSGLYAVPFATPPAKVVAATKIFILETIYQRRGAKPEDNPFAKQAAWWRDHLQKVGNREIPFDAAIDKAFAPGAAITETASCDAQST